MFYEFEENATTEECIDLDEVVDLWKRTNSTKQIKFILKNQIETIVELTSSKTRDKCYKEIISLLKKTNNKKGGFTPMESIKNYFNKHQEGIMNLVFLFLLDEFIFDGKFKIRIKDIIENMFNKTEKKLLGENNE